MSTNNASDAYKGFEFLYVSECFNACELHRVFFRELHRVKGVNTPVVRVYNDSFERSNAQCERRKVVKYTVQWVNGADPK